MPAERHKINYLAAMAIVAGSIITSGRKKIPSWLSRNGIFYIICKRYFRELIHPAIFNASLFGTCGMGGISVA